MVHFTIDEFNFAGYRFIWEYDTGMGPGGENIIYARGPVELTRCFYFEDVDERHIENFCKKFAHDAEYRRRCLDGTIPWARLSDLYELNAQCLEREYELKHGPIFHVYEAGDRQAKQKHERVQEKFLDDCRNMYYFLGKNLDTVVRDPVYLRCEELKLGHEHRHNPMELDKQMEPIILKINNIPGVRTQFSCQGVGESIIVEGKTILVPDGHMPFAIETNRSQVQRLRTDQHKLEMQEIWHSCTRARLLDKGLLVKS